MSNLFSIMSQAAGYTEIPRWYTDLSTMSSAVQTLATSPETTPYGCCWGDDGNYFYLTGSATDTIRGYSTSSAYSLSGATYMGNLSISGQEASTPRALRVSLDGTSIYMLGDTGDNVYQYDMTTPFDITSASYSSKSLSVGTQDGNCLGIDISRDGTKLYMIGTQNDKIYQYTLSTAFDISTASFDSKEVSWAGTGPTTPAGVKISAGGDKVYIAANSPDTTYEFALSVDFDISTMASTPTASASHATGGNALMQGFDISADGTEMIATDSTDDLLYRHTIGTAP